MDSTETPVTDMTPVCAVTGISKRYGGVQALLEVDFEAYPGGIHAIVGENGAGKSTLMKIIVGAERSDEGELVIGGAPKLFSNVREANQAGIAIVFQELSLFPDLDVLANLFPHAEGNRFGAIDRNRLSDLALPVLAELGLNLNLDSEVGRLTLGEQQLVEIAKAVLADATILVLDEPNSALNAAETQRLFEVMRSLAARGVCILFISHRLEEVFEICDHITIMRNGRIVAESAVADTTIPKVVADMIGRTADDAAVPPATTQRSGGRSLVVDSISVAGALNEVSLTANAGEILGLAGLEGSGASTILHAVFGSVPVQSGTVILPGGTKTGPTIEARVKSGVAMIPADRRQEGLHLSESIVDNLALVTAGTLGRHGFRLSRGDLRKGALKQAERLTIAFDDPEAPVTVLSGGNQQKVVLGKWLQAEPQVILLDDPTRGVDVGAKHEIYGIVHDLARAGHIILFVSSELAEYSQLCHRVAIFYRGRKVGQMDGQSATSRALLTAINTGAVDGKAAKSNAGES